MQRSIWSLALLLLTAGACMASPHPRRAAPAKSRDAVVKRLVRLNIRSHKASPPLTITFVPGPSLRAGHQRARVWVKPLVDAERLEIEVETRDGLAIEHGRHQWQTAARKDSAVSEALVLATNGKGERGLLITATIYFADGTSLTGVEAYVLNPEGRVVPPPVPGTREIVTPSGERILEIPVKPGS